MGSVFGLQNNNPANRPMFVYNRWKFQFKKLNLKTVTGTFKNTRTTTKKYNLGNFFLLFCS